jgi:hypothetical protein
MKKITESRGDMCSLDRSARGKRRRLARTGAHGIQSARPTGPHQLGKKCTRAATNARMVVLARSVGLARLLGWLASLGDGPMDPSP